MPPRQFDAEWTAWVRTKLEAGVDRAELRDVLLRNGFRLEVIAEGMGGAFPGPPEATDPRVDHASLCSVRLTELNQPNVLRLPLSHAQVYLIENFLTAAECDGIAALIREAIRPSTVTLQVEHSFRTSSTCDLYRSADPRVAALDQKIADTLGISPAYSENIQGQLYEVGQEFKLHRDFFVKGTAEYDRHCAVQGNRTWTFMVYLNDVEGGGATAFPALGYEIQPLKGSALVWNNLHPDGSPNAETLHAGTPVTKGAKTIVTKWFRERGAGPMLL